MSQADKSRSPLVKDPALLARAIGVEFDNSAWLDLALRHRSAGAQNNERLEFLGDSVLNFVIAAQLFHLRPDAPEGALSRLRASVVREETLAEVARLLELGDYLVLGSGELKSGGFRRSSILADAVEAIIGAVYLDRGFDVAQGLVVRLFQDILENLPEAAKLKDPKTRLQEYLQGQRRELPSYEVVDVQGQAHRQVFEVVCRVSDPDAKTQARGSSRRKAEQAAAEKMLSSLAGSGTSS